METGKIAEAVILQSIEDLWRSSERRKSIEFFKGDGFRLAADIAGLGMIERLRLLNLLGKILALRTRPRRRGHSNGR